MINCSGFAKNDAPAHVQAGYTLAFNDEFTGTQLDPNKWVTHFPWGSQVIINNEHQYYVDTLAAGGDPFITVNPFSFDGDNLIITAEPVADPSTLIMPTGGLPGGQEYTSGIITTHESFRFNNAYVEVCAKVPCDAMGSWPAFWLHHAIFTGHRPEVDFAEIVNGNGLTTNCVQQAYHYYTGTKDTVDEILWSLTPGGFQGVQVNPPAGQAPQIFPAQYTDCSGSNAFSTPSTCLPNGEDFCDDFHTFGTDYCPEDGTIDYYVDGVRTHCVSNVPMGGPDDQVYLLINLAVGGNYPGPPDPADYPASMQVDYARIWTK